jgi:hypothetical protein
LSAVLVTLDSACFAVVALGRFLRNGELAFVLVDVASIEVIGILWTFGFSMVASACALFCVDVRSTSPAATSPATARAMWPSFALFRLLVISLAFDFALKLAALEMIRFARFDLVVIGAVAINIHVARQRLLIACGSRRVLIIRPR